MTVLLVDQGNTAVKFQIRGVRGEVLQPTQRILNFSSINSNSELNNYFKLESISNIAIASVANTAAKSWLADLLKRVCDAVTCYTASTQSEIQILDNSIKNSYKDPAQMGVDRWMAIIASTLLYPCYPIVVVDAGSAVTIEIINDEATHLGGYIIPGISAMLDALYSGTGQVQVKSSVATAASITPGTSTTDCVNGGITSAIIGLIEQSVELFDQNANSSDVKLVMAGGDANLLAPHVSKSVDIQPNLVLDGLFYWFTVNCTQYSKCEIAR